jgi:hypothetical protein
MLFSRKNKKAKETKESGVQDKVARGIAGFLLSIQNRFTEFMGTMTNSLNKKGKQVFLGFICLLFGGLSIYAFLGAFRENDNSGKSIKPSQLSVPKYYDRTDGEIQEPVVSEREINRINRFKKYMDSLSYSPTGRAKYDSILKTRPGLMDSIKIIEAIYYSQSK